MERVRIQPAGAISKVNPDWRTENDLLKSKISSHQRNKTLGPTLLGLGPDRLRVPQIEIVPLKSLKRSFRNARTHSKRQIQQIANSIRQFGWTSAILTDEHGNIIAGAGRHEAAELLELKTVPIVRVSGLTETKKRALALGDNKIAANAGWDRAILAAELGELALLLPECELNIEITGFEPSEIDALMDDLADPEFDATDEVPALPAQAVFKRFARSC